MDEGEINYYLLYCKKLTGTGKDEVLFVLLISV
jgi:hypothetical protein